MIFQYTIDKVLSGQKTLTSRLKKPGQYAVCINERIAWIATPTGRRLWSVGHDYPIQAGRTCKAEGRFVVSALGDYDVRGITEDDVRREGFAHRSEFLFVWCRMHDKVWYRRYLETAPIHGGDVSPVVLPEFFNALYKRPDYLYGAWQIGFKVIA